MGLHKGYRAKTRRLHRKNVRKRGLGSTEKYLIEFDIGDKVDIITDPSVQKRGMPHRRMHGKTGTIIGVRGRCYEVQVRIGKSKKMIILGKEHLRKNQGNQTIAA